MYIRDTCIDLSINRNMYLWNKPIILFTLFLACFKAKTITQKETFRCQIILIKRLLLIGCYFAILYMKPTKCGN